MIIFVESVKNVENVEAMTTPINHSLHTKFCLVTLDWLVNLERCVICVNIYINTPSATDMTSFFLGMEQCIYDRCVMWECYTE